MSYTGKYASSTDIQPGTNRNAFAASPYRAGKGLDRINRTGATIAKIADKTIGAFVFARNKARSIAGKVYKGILLK